MSTARGSAGARAELGRLARQVRVDLQAPARRKVAEGYGEVSAEDVNFPSTGRSTPSSAARMPANFTGIQSGRGGRSLTVRFKLKKAERSSMSRRCCPLRPLHRAEGGRGKARRRIRPQPGRQRAVRVRRIQAAGIGDTQIVQGLLPAVPRRCQTSVPLHPADNAATIAFIGKEIDQTSGPREPRWVEQIQKARADAQVSIMTPGSLQFLHFNMKVKPLDDVRVRRHRLCDRPQAVGAGFRRGARPPARDRAGRVLWCAAHLRNSGDLRYDYDPAKAKALLGRPACPTASRWRRSPPSARTIARTC